MIPSARSISLSLSVRGSAKTNVFNRRPRSGCLSLKIIMQISHVLMRPDSERSEVHYTCGKMNVVGVVRYSINLSLPASSSPSLRLCQWINSRLKIESNQRCLLTQSVENKRWTERKIAAFCIDRWREIIFAELTTVITNPRGKIAIDTWK